MLKIPKDKIETLEFSIRGKTYGEERTYKPIIKELDSIEIGEGVLVMSDEWSGKTSISSYINYWRRAEHKQKKFSTRTLADKSGVCVIRVV